MRRDSSVGPARVRIVGTEIDNLTIEEAVLAVSGLIEEGRFSFTVTPNVDHLMKLRRDPAFGEVYKVADLVVPDGVPLIWASRFLGTPLKGRVNGTDLMERLVAMAAKRGYSIFLLGGAGDSAEHATRALQERFQHLRVAGFSSPSVGFHEDPLENERVKRQIADASSTLLFVGLGAPKQENWIVQHAKSTGVVHAVGVGASFSFISRRTRRAPVWMQRSGLEWFWRLVHEPRRLARRYLIEGPPFFLLVIAQRWHLFRGHR